MLKRKLLEEYWKEKPEDMQMGSKIKLYISPELKRKLNDEMILETDIEKVVEHCETSGRKIVDADSNSFSGHLLIGNMTYWVEYHSKDDGYELLNAYSHRMKIEEE